MDVEKENRDLKLQIEELQEKIEALEKDNEELEDELEELKHNDYSKGAPLASNAELYEELRILRSEKSKLEKENELMAKDIEKVNASLKKEREAHQQLQQELREEKLSIQDLERELETYKRETKDLRKQIGSTQLKSQTKQQDEKDFKDKLQAKNQEIDKYLIDIQALTERNAHLEEQVKDLLGELELATKEAELGQSSVTEKKAMFEELEQHVASLESDNELLQSKLAQMQDQVKVAEELREEMWSQFNTKLAEWKTAVEERDRIIVDKETQVHKLEVQLADLKPAEQNLEAYDDTFEGLKKAVVDRDKKIAQLQMRLTETEEDFQLLSQEFDRLKQGTDQEIQFALRDHRKRTESSKLETLKLSDTLQQERKKYIEQKNQIEEAQKEILHLKSVIMQYEKGYGIEDAVRDIKAEKEQTLLREKQIEELLGQIGTKEQQLSNLYDKYRAARMKASLSLHQDDEDADLLNELQLKDKLELQQLRAVNSQYQKEIHELEEERLKLKSALRLEALNQGERAMKLGLSHQDLVALENYANTLRYGKQHSNEEPNNLELRKEVSRLSAELTKTKKQLTIAELKYEEMQEQEQTAHPASLRIQPQGVTNASLQIEPAYVKELLAELKRLSGTQQRDGKLDAQPLKFNVTQDDAHYLAQQLLECLEELKVKESENAELVAQLAVNDEAFTRLKQQLQVLYSQHALARDIGADKTKQLEQDLATLRVKHDEVLGKVGVLETTLHSITASSNEGDLQRKIADDAKELILLKASEASLMRRSQSLVETEAMLRKENQKLRTELMDVEKFTKERIAYLDSLQRKQYAQLVAFQDRLSQSVSDEEHQKLCTNYNVLYNKYNDVLNKQKDIMSQYLLKDRQLKNVEELQDQMAQLQLNLQHETARCQRLELALEELKLRPDITSLMSQIVSLEISEANARKKAELSRKQLEAFYATQTDLEDRINTLEKENIELMSSKHHLMDKEANLKNTLLESLSKEDTLQLRTQLVKLQEDNDHLDSELSKYKELYSVAVKQSSIIQDKIDKDINELEHLRTSVRELETLTDANAVIGRLHREFLLAQVNEAQATRKLEHAQMELQAVHSKLGKLERILEDRMDTLFNMKATYRAKTKELQSQMHDLSHNKEHLDKMELLISSLYNLELKRQEDERKLQLLEKSCSALQAEKEDLQISLKQKELLLSVGQIPVNIASLHDEITSLKLTEARLQRQHAILEQRDQYLSNLNDKLSQNCKKLEDDLQQNEKMFQQKIGLSQEQIRHLESQLLDKDRDSDLKLLIAHKASLESTLDPSLPMTVRLEQALSKLEATENRANELNLQVIQLQQRTEDLQQAIQHKEELLLVKEAKIQDLIGKQLTLHTQSSNNHDLREKTTVLDYTTLQNLYVSAQEEIERLEKLLIKKEESAVKFQEMLQQARLDYQHELQSANNQIASLTDQLHSHAEFSVKSLKNVLERSSTDVKVNPEAEQLTLHVSAQEMDQLLLQKEAQLRDANLQLNSSKKDVLSLTDALNDRDSIILQMQRQNALNIQAKDQEIQQIQQEHDTAVQALQNEAHEVIRELKEQMIQLSEVLTSEKESILKEKQAEVDKLESELHSLRNELDTGSVVDGKLNTTKSSSMVVKRLQNQLSLKDKQIKTHQDAIVLLKQELIQAYEKSSDQHSVSVTQSEHEEKINQLQESIRKLERTKASTEEQLKAAQQENSKLSGTLQTERDQQQAALLKLNQELKRSQKIIKSYKDKLDAQSKELELSQRKDHRIQELENRIKQFSSVKKTSTVNSLDQQSGTTVQAKLDEKQKEIDSLTKVLQQQVTDLTDRQNLISELQQKIANLEQSRGDTTVEVNNTTSKTAREADYHAVIDALKKVVDKLKTENNDLRKNVVNSTKHVEAATDNKKLKKQITDLQSELSMLRADSQKEQLQSQLTRSLETVSKLRQVVQDLSKTNANLEDKLKSMETSFSALDDTYRRDKIKMQESLGLLEYKLSTQENDMARKDILIAQLKNQLKKIPAK